MARWRPAARWARPTTARVLTDRDVAEALAVCAKDPVGSVLAASRLLVAEQSGLRAAGGNAWGFPAEGPLEAVCWSGANLVPILIPGLSRRRRLEALDAFAGLARRHGRRSSSIVGDQSAVLDLWSRLVEVWPPAREVRSNQPSLAIEGPAAIEPDVLVRHSTPGELPLVFPACVSMFTEEVGYSPVEGGGRAYEDRVRSLISAGRSYVRLGDDPPHVVFKAEIGAATSQVAQVQGVWVNPRYRGRGLSGPGMAAVVALARAEIAPVVSLYVNDFNTRALAAYRSVGFEQVGTYATVLF